MAYSRKITKTWPRSELDLTDVPSSYMRTAGQIKESHRGTVNLKDRNKQIYDDLLEWAKEVNAQISVIREGNHTHYTLNGLGITVSLLNS